MIPLIGITTSTLAAQGLVTTQYGTNQTYVDWVRRAGGAPVLLPNTDAALAEPLLDRLDGLLATGGWDVHPSCYGAEPERHLGTVDVPRDRFELPLVRAALARALPLLGICRGIQILNVAAGGTLRQDLDHDPHATVQHRMAAVGAATPHHTVTFAPGSDLRALVGVDAAAVNSYHHQAVDRLGEGLRVAATAADGTVEAVEGAGTGGWALGVQWHPELMDPDDRVTAALFQAFLNAAGAQG